MQKRALNNAFKFKLCSLTTVYNLFQGFQGSFCFSMSGLKTFVKQLIKQLNDLLMHSKMSHII